MSTTTNAERAASTTRFCGSAESARGFAATGGRTSETRLAATRHWLLGADPMGRPGPRLSSLILTSLHAADDALDQVAHALDVLHGHDDARRRRSRAVLLGERASPHHTLSTQDLGLRGSDLLFDRR